MAGEKQTKKEEATIELLLNELTLYLWEASGDGSYTIKLSPKQMGVLGRRFFEADSDNKITKHLKTLTINTDVGIVTLTRDD